MQLLRRAGWGTPLCRELPPAAKGERDLTPERYPRLGPKRVKDLLAHFRSIDAIQLASADVSECPGVGPALALQIHEFFHPQAETEPEVRQLTEAFAADPSGAPVV